MRFSIVNKVRVEPFPKGKGFCPICGNETLAKCGNRIVWHWAHRSIQTCDAWWENETKWHRDWKNIWPIENQEIIHFDKDTGEKHIADVKTDSGMVIELQNSPIDEEELLSREIFYGNMIWIVNGMKFKKNIKIGTRLPNPESSESKDMCIYDSIFPHGHFVYHKLSERVSDSDMVEIHSSDKIQEYVDRTHCGHYLFSWKRRRSVWFSSTKMVFIDFGDDILWKLVKYNQCSPYCFQAYNKSEISMLYGGKVRHNKLIQRGFQT